ncbi:MAG: hypothetical protein AB8B56_19475 [Crocinitomicaceae bacterium]
MRAERIVAGLMVVGVVMWSFSTGFAQVMTFNFHPDGTMTNTYDGPKGYSIEHYDDQMRIIEVSHYFPGGKRMKMFDKYRYEDNMLAEKISYIYTQGYERETFKYNQYGYETESRHYASQTEGNWAEDHYVINEYDDWNNTVYFRSKGTRFGLVNLMSRTNYDYDHRTRSVIEYEFDGNDREVASRSHRSGLADWQMERKGKFVFDIDTHGENVRHNRVINWKGTDYNGNRVEKVLINHDIIARTFDQNDRIVRIEIGNPSYDDNKNLFYEYDKVIDFKYDRKGRLIETVSKHYSQMQEKWEYKHGRAIEAKHYRMRSNGGWKLLKTNTVNSIDIFTPKYGTYMNPSSSAASSVQQQQAGAAISHIPPVQNSGSTASKPELTHSLVNDVNGLPIESSESEMLSAFSIDADRLAHIADVLSHATGTKITEEQVLALAMQLLIENYNADLREMNNDYLRDKVSVFD